MTKPPAFQFYAKDWRSSPTVARMSWIQKGVAIDLMALSWESDDQGTIPSDPRIVQKLTRIRTETLQNFYRNFPEFFQKCADPSKLVCTKLYEQAAKYRDISEKRKQAASKSSANAKQLGGSAVAVAFAVATKDLNLHPRGKLSRGPHEQKRNVEAKTTREAKEAAGHREAQVGAFDPNRAIAMVAESKAIPYSPPSPAECERRRQDQLSRLAAATKADLK